MRAPLLASALAAELGAQLLGPDQGIETLAPLSEAATGSLTFVTDPAKYEAAVAHALSLPCTLLAPPALEVPASASASVIRVSNPRAAFAQATARHFSPEVVPGIAETARVHPGAEIHPTTSIGEFTVVREGAVIGAHCEIRDHVVIGKDVRVGAHTLVKSHAVIGEEGFGMEKDEDGNNFRVPHLGSVEIGEHVEVGCFTTVCAGTIRPTVVGDYTKIDDHVHVAHNCRIERNVIITACAEISGSVTLEDEVWLGPNSSIIQGVTLAKGSLLGIGAVSLKSAGEGEVWVGNPAKPLPPKPRQGAQ